MKKLFGLSLMVALAVFVAIGCQNGPSPTQSGIDNTTAPPQTLKFVPDGATLESATFHIFVTQDNAQNIFIHRITSDWDEMTVTHNNFGGAFDAASVGSFTADATGYKTADITSLVESWDDGTFDNFGILLDQDEFNTPRAKYLSKDYGANPPMLVVCYTMDGQSTCDTLIAVEDSYIWEVRPDMNYGAEDLLFTGWVAENDFEKQSLIKFMSEEEPPMEGCTRTIGFWKNHAGFGPQDDVLSQYLPITLGNGGGESVVVTTAEEAVDILTMGKGKSKNGTSKLMAQLLAAKLNMAAGADGSDIADYVDDADDFLTDYSSEDWDMLDDEMQEHVLMLKDMFDDYNNGIIGPGHCDDFDDDDDDDDDYDDDDEDDEDDEDDDDDDDDDEDE